MCYKNVDEIIIEIQPYGLKIRDDDYVKHCATIQLHIKIALIVLNKKYLLWKKLFMKKNRHIHGRKRKGENKSACSGWKNSFTADFLFFTIPINSTFFTVFKVACFINYDSIFHSEESFCFICCFFLRWWVCRIRVSCILCHVKYARKLHFIHIVYQWTIGGSHK